MTENRMYESPFGEFNEEEMCVVRALHDNRYTMRTEKALVREGDKKGINKESILMTIENLRERRLVVEIVNRETDEVFYAFLPRIILERLQNSPLNETTSDIDEGITIPSNRIIH